MLRKTSCVLILCFFLFPPIFVQASAHVNQNLLSDEEYNFFPFAIIWGEFEILNEKHFLRGLDVYNPYPYNKTMHVIGFVGHDSIVIYKDAAFVYCPWWLGVVGQHRLFVIGWGDSVAAY